MDTSLSPSEIPALDPMALDHGADAAPLRFTLVTAGWTLLGHALLWTPLMLGVLTLAWALDVLLFEPFSLLAAGSVFGATGWVWAAASRLSVPHSAPSGHLITPQEAPKLFALIAKVCRRCKVPAPRVVMLGWEMNAARIDPPGLLAKSWRRPVLVLGLPMLLTLSPRQLAAVVAHECTHAQGLQGFLGSWIVGSHHVWMRQIRQAEQASWRLIPMALRRFFFERFWLRLERRVKVVARLLELAADRRAAGAMGAPVLAAALQRLAIYSAYLDEVFWPQALKAVLQHPAPAGSPYRAMRRSLREATQLPLRTTWLREAMERHQNPEQGHPTLLQRLRALGMTAGVPAEAGGTAADLLCGKALAHWLVQADALWRIRVDRAWSLAHRAALKDQAMLQGYEQAGQAGTLPEADLLLWARTAWQWQDPSAARGVLQHTLARFPGSEEAMLWLARVEIRLAEQGMAAQRMDAMQHEETGVRLLETLVRRPPSQWVLSGARLLRAQYETRGDLEAAESLAPLVEHLEAQARLAWRALQDWDIQAELWACDHSPQVLRPILEVLRCEPAVEQAWLLRRVSNAYPGWQLHVLVLARRAGRPQPPVRWWCKELQSRIAWSTRLVVLDLTDPQWSSPEKVRLVNRFMQVDAQIYG